MHSEKQELTDEDVADIIYVWQFTRPIEPDTPEPLFVWPNQTPFLFIQYPLRVWLYERKMRRSGWRKYRIEYNLWFNRVRNRFAELVGEDEERGNPQLSRLSEYVHLAMSRLSENTISHNELKQQKARVKASR